MPWSPLTLCLVQMLQETMGAETKHYKKDLWSIVTPVLHVSLLKLVLFGSYIERHIEDIAVQE